MFTVTIMSGSSLNDDFDGYYESITATAGSALKTQLRTLLTNTHDLMTSYDSLKDHLQDADEDPNNPDNMILFYTGDSVPKTANMNVWNREHVWAKSLGWFVESGAGSDAHHIRPCIPNVNSSRSNKKFGTETTTDYYYPGDEFKGDVARIIFYLMTRYSESDSYSFTSIAVSLDVLLLWNDQDPVSVLEINRNEVVYGIQGNRNPFIDNPDYADAIWA